MLEYLNIFMLFKYDEIYNINIKDGFVLCSILKSIGNLIIILNVDPC